MNPAVTMQAMEFVSKHDIVLVVATEKSSGKIVVKLISKVDATQARSIAQAIFEEVNKQ